MNMKCKRKRIFINYPRAIKKLKGNLAANLDNRRPILLEKQFGFFLFFFLDILSFSNLYFFSTLFQYSLPSVCIVVGWGWWIRKCLNKPSTYVVIFELSTRVYCIGVGMVRYEMA